MTAQTFEAVVVGGGLAGRAAAIALARAGLSTLHLSPKAPPDRRTSALMQPSVAFLERLGVVDDPAALGNPLRRIRIIDATRRLIRAPEVVFDSADAGLAAFGWNFPNVRLAEAFEKAAAGLTTLSTAEAGATSIAFGDGEATVTLTDGRTVMTPLTVGADGKRSMVRAAAGIALREHRFDQAALVCDLELGRPIGDTSVEFHYEHGPFTLVPAGGSRANLVWIDRASVLEAARAEGGEALLSRLAERSQNLFGHLALASPSFVFPLSTLSVSAAGAKSAVLVGEAAHAFPPIGAQGLNLGLRDVSDLADLLHGVDRGEPLWGERLAAAYARARSGDLARTGAMVDSLFRSLLAEMLPAQALRAGGLWALKLAPPLRRQAFSLGMGAR
ncbi:MAG TPA: FAD-dependent monooxygenase [Devosiaceae bacterium]|nr:FAD-dependent monooxygenase [Devosiaceae bacterium]